MEVDAVLAERAAKNSAAAGLAPLIVHGDGARGWPAGAPYQRVIATYAVAEIPYARRARSRVIRRSCGPATPAPRGYLDDFLHHREDATETTTDLSPLALAQDADALFFVGLALPDAWHLPVTADDGSGEVTVWILADDRSSWASADYAPDRQEYAVVQYGPRRLWDEARAAYRHWDHLGRPARDRAGLSVTAHGQQVWLDTPDHVLRPTG